MATGLWNIGGVNLPDFGVSENPIVQSIWSSAKGVNNPGLTTGAVQGTNLTGQSKPATIPQISQPVNMFNLQGTKPINPTTPPPPGSPTGNPTGSPTGNPSVLGAMTTNTGTQLTQPDQGSLIGGAWDSYISQLDNMLNTGLPGQMSGLQQQAQSSADLATNQAETNKTSSTNQLNQQQSSSLKDLGENVKNLFQAGNTYLGARGAGDSSAANQYAYAISKMGTKERGNIMNQANQRMQQIGDIYNSEKARINSELQNQLGGIAQWFNQAQMALRSQIGQAGVSKQNDINNASQQLLNQALATKQQVEAQYANLASGLQTWAMNNSANTSELIKNFQTITNSMPLFNGLTNAMPNLSGSQTALPVGYAGTTQKIDPNTGLPI